MKNGKQKDWEKIKVKIYLKSLIKILNDFLLN